MNAILTGNIISLPTPYPLRVPNLVSHRGVTSKNWEPERILRGVARRDPEAVRALFSRYSERINRRVWRLLGSDPEHNDVVQQVFLHILTSIDQVKDPKSLVSWIDTVIVNTVRKEIRKRTRHRWITFYSEPPEQEGRANQETTHLFERSLKVLRSMKDDDRIAFVLRFVEQEELTDIAATCGWSLATTKRRVAKVKSIFSKKAKRDPQLALHAKEMGFE